MKVTLEKEKNKIYYKEWLRDPFILARNRQDLICIAHLNKWLNNEKIEYVICFRCGGLGTIALEEVSEHGKN